MRDPGRLAREAMAHLDALHDHGRYLTRNDAEAEDLVQETYLRALGAAETFTGGNLKAWLFRIQTNAFIDQRRRSRHQAPAFDPGVLDGLAADDPAPADEAELAQLRRVTAAEIGAALYSLADEARSIVLLDLEGFTETEVADIVGCAVGTVKSRLSRARAALRERLKDHRP